MGACCSAEAITVQSRYRYMKEELAKLRLEDKMRALLTLLLAVDSVDTLEPEGLYHPELLQEAIRFVQVVLYLAEVEKAWLIKVAV